MVDLAHCMQRATKHTREICQPLPTAPSQLASIQAAHAVAVVLPLNDWLVTHTTGETTVFRVVIFTQDSSLWCHYNEKRVQHNSWEASSTHHDS